MNFEQEENHLYIQYANKFNAIKIYNRNLIITELNVESDIFIENEDFFVDNLDDEIDFVLLKLQIFFDLCLNNSIIFSINNDFAMNFTIDKKNNKKKVENNIILTPGEPGDDHLAILFQSKFNAIGNEKIFFSSVTINNKRSKRVKFTFVGEGKQILPNMKSWIGNECYHNEPWWCRNDLSTMDLPKEGNFEKPFYDLNFDSIMLGNIFEISKIDNVSSDQYESKIIRPKFKPRIIKNEELNNENDKNE